MVPLEPSAQGATSIPPPEGFGPPLTFEPGFVLKNRTWVIARTVKIALSAGKAYKPSDGRLSLEELRRLHNQHVKLSSSAPSPNVLPPERFTLSMSCPTGTIYLGSIESDDDDDDGDPQDQEDDGIDIATFMEFLHNAAAYMNPDAAEMAKKYADRRKELLENRVFEWMHTIQ
ncbi:hypothetical protein BGX38DRAFT_1215216 [Terfezia claveryi]|nr:hypothetical protein BGX38DRAFT_1215216 [Terfezia claveryi]